MEFSKLTFTTRFKLVAGNVLMLIGIFMVLTSDSLQGMILLVVGNIIGLDGRISRLEEMNESNGKQANQDS